jgi:hypothetical protein
VIVKLTLQDHLKIAPKNPCPVSALNSNPDSSALSQGYTLRQFTPIA